MTDGVTIYVALLDDGVDVWRPVRAERVSGSAYRIVNQPYDRDIEHWQFEPGDIVFCEAVDLDGECVLAATQKASQS